MRHSDKRLFDNHGRVINYLRLAVTDRCNLRCFYCMPEEGIDYIPRSELLSYEEMLRMVAVLADMGIQKIRITGGEPFLRKDMIYFLSQLVKIKGIEEVHITTNGTLTTPLLPELKRMGIRSINLSLDTLDKERFYEITRRDTYEKVWNCFEQLVALDIPTKINMVVMEQHNVEDILPMANLTRDYPVGVRFIEEMPFNGSGSHHPVLNWNFRKIMEHIRSSYPEMEKLQDGPFSTSANYRIKGFKGTIGTIAAFSRTFCGTCNRIRITPKGMLKTCLYDSGVFNVRDVIRAGASDKQLQETFLQALGNRAKDGYEAEQRRGFGNAVSESMSTIGG